MKCSCRRSASAASTGRLSAITPPNAESGSQASAFSYASPTSSAIAAPQGLLCLTITHAGSSNSSSSRRAESRSRTLLNESARPCSFATRESTCERAAGLDVERRLLVRVLAVGEVEELLVRHHASGSG